MTSSRMTTTSARSFCAATFRRGAACTSNYARDLLDAKRFEEARSLLRKTIPVARRALGDPHDLTLSMRSLYAQTLYIGDGATLDDQREAVTTLEGAGRIARRVLGGVHPLTTVIESNLRNARDLLRVREMRPK